VVTPEPAQCHDIAFFDPRRQLGQKLPVACRIFQLNADFAIEAGKKVASRRPWAHSSGLRHVWAMAFFGLGIDVCAFAGELPIGHEPVENAFGQRGIVDLFVPTLDGIWLVRIVERSA